MLLIHDNDTNGLGIKINWSVPIILAVLFLLPGRLLSQQMSGEQIRSAVGVDAGLYIHLGSGDGSTTIGLSDGKRILVHGLAKTNEDLELSRIAIDKAGLDGMVSVERAVSWNPLPYAQNIANVIVADLDALGSLAPPESELLRVVAPFGVLYTKQNGSWKKVNVPLTPGMAEWTHYEAGPEGNPYTPDTHVNASLSLQWIGGYWTRSGKVNNMRIAGGRVSYYRTLEGKEISTPTGKHHLVTRDAFNGVLEYRKPVGNRIERGGAFILSGNKIYTIDLSKKNLVALDASTGNLLRTYDKTGTWQSSDKKATDLGLAYEGGVLYAANRQNLYAVDEATGDIKWTYSEGDSTYMYYVRTSASSDNVYALTTSQVGWNLNNHSHWAISGVKSIVCLDKKTGNLKWRNDAIRPVISNMLIGPDGDLYVFARDATYKNTKFTSFKARYSKNDGKELWFHKQGDAKVNTSWDRAETMAVGGKYGVAISDIGGASFNLATGKAEKLFEYNGSGLCLGGFMTPNFVFTGYGHHFKPVDNNLITTSWTARGCNERPFPAYGMMYVGESGCQCYINFGGVKAASSEPFGKILDDSKRLEKNPSLSKVSAISKALTCSICYNYSPETAVGPVTISESPVKDDWVTSDAFRGTKAEVTSDGVTYTAHIHQQRIDAVRNGTKLWSFKAGGRISSAPIIAGNFCLFGSHDGWVYAVDAQNGKLAWRFLAAPYERKIVAYSQVESSWPVFGVAVSGGKVFATAGWHPELNGGIFAYALNIPDGRMVWKQRVTRMNLDWQSVGNSTLYDGQKSGRPRHDAVNAAPVIKDGNVELPGIHLSTANGNLIPFGDRYLLTSEGPYSVSTRKGNNLVADWVTSSTGSIYALLVPDVNGRILVQQLSGKPAKSLHIFSEQGRQLALISIEVGQSHVDLPSDLQRQVLFARWQ